MLATIDWTVFFGAFFAGVGGCAVVVFGAWANMRGKIRDGDVKLVQLRIDLEKAKEAAAIAHCAAIKAEARADAQDKSIDRVAEDGRQTAAKLVDVAAAQTPPANGSNGT